MNQIILFKNDFVEENLVSLKERRYEHIKEIHRAKVGDTLKVGLLNELQGSAEVLKLSDKEIVLKTVLDSKPPAPLPLNLVMALPRPQTLKKVLQFVTAVGVKNIYIIHSKRVEKSYWHSPLLNSENLEKHLLLGLEQARDTIMPKIVMKNYFKNFVLDELPEIAKETTKIVAHPDTERECPYNLKEATTLAIGPEGGFIDYEIEQFEKIGFSTFHLGERILRVEHAIPLIIGKLF